MYEDETRLKGVSVTSLAGSSARTDGRDETALTALRNADNSFGENDRFCLVLFIYLF